MIKKIEWIITKVSHKSINVNIGSEIVYKRGHKGNKLQIIKFNYLDLSSTSQPRANVSLKDISYQCINLFCLNF